MRRLLLSKIVKRFQQQRRRASSPENRTSNIYLVRRNYPQRRPPPARVGYHPAGRKEPPGQAQSGFDRFGHPEKDQRRSNLSLATATKSIRAENRRKRGKEGSMISEISLIF
ncbi:MAG: hypothetical protein U5J82_03405 [Desulfobacterales bacterium]|nr:hypothetical protein [Desulfobacterales bacterium]